MSSGAGDLPRGYHLRELAADDGPAIGRLFDDSPDTGMIRFRPVFQVDPYVALTYGGRETGVVVERDDGAGLVGLGLVAIDDLVIRGRSTPFALLHSLVVHPDARRQGVAGAIVSVAPGSSRGAPWAGRHPRRDHPAQQRGLVPRSLEVGDPDLRAAVLGRDRAQVRGAVAPRRDLPPARTPG